MSVVKHYRSTVARSGVFRGLSVAFVMLLLSGCQYLEQSDWLPDGWFGKQTEQDPTERARKKVVDRLLEKGDLAFTKDRLSSPANDNAVLYYREVLKISPNNVDAIKGLTRVSKRYRNLARTAHDNGDTAQARKYVALAESVTGTNDPANIKLRQQLQQTPSGQDQRALDKSLQREIKARKQQLEDRQPTRNELP